MAELKIETLAPCSGRTLVIGDVHGCAGELEELLAAFAPQPGDRLLAVGDLVNRGPDSPAVLAMARRLGIVSVMGNHEARLLKGWRHRNPSVIKPKDRPTFAQLQEEDFAWMASWPHVLRDPQLNLLVVHGGFVPNQPWQEQDTSVVTRIQVLDRAGRPRRRAEIPAGRPWAVSWQGPEHVVYGHTPRPQVLRHPLATGIDTGCVYGYSLSAVSLPDFTLFQVRAKRAYADD